ncbi:TSC22 domain family protein 4-like isoform X3 [Syngnathus typhle]|uniref:TSC22 domain family protein 4-like isoform X3 n=1 Tax=Syngnathus typhle TaxID=161592 RepID=UPI002A6B163D|nr:TSC22 domain family protein 4-like isoform X3 [Syngnathus typhle]
MTCEKKRSGFQITSVTSDLSQSWAGQSAPGVILTVVQASSASRSPRGSSSQPTTPSLKRKHTSHDALGQGASASSRFRLVRLAGGGTGGRGHGDTYGRGRWMCTDFTEGLKRSVLRLSRSQPSSPPPTLTLIPTPATFSLDNSAAFSLPTDISVVAIDNKIEQAMDLVKSHLMLAVREEVELLREQIRELQERNQQLEAENRALRAQAHSDPRPPSPGPVPTSQRDNSPTQGGV